MVSEICMGCMGFGDPTRGQHTWTLDEKVPEKSSYRGLKQALISLILRLLIKAEPAKSI